jgi:cytochrome c5
MYLYRNLGYLVFAGAALCFACEGDEGKTAERTNESEPDDEQGPEATGTRTDALSCEDDDGKCIFRHDTFGGEQHWTKTLRLHELVQGLTPTAALALGLKVDAEAVPDDVLEDADLEAAETTVALLSLHAVVGLNATIEDGNVTEIGVTCALCHSTVDDSVAPGIGKRLDGWPNRDLNVGAVIAATPGVGNLAVSLDVRTNVAKNLLGNWGPGRYDARFNQDGESFPVLIPPAYGLEGVALATYTGDGTISYWNAYVAVTQMGGQGEFVEEALDIHVDADPDMVTRKLPALREYQFSLDPPGAPASSFNAAAAARGDVTFDTACAGCHAGDSYTDAPLLHEPSETGMEANAARRSVTGKYRTTPLRGVATHPPYFHDGSAASLDEVVAHYDSTLELELTEDEKSDLVEYLKSL